MSTPEEKWLFSDLGTVPYKTAYQFQTRLSEMRSRGDLHQNIVLLVEHLPVFTTGKRGGRHNLVVEDAVLQESGIDVVPIERGGDITYHGPGQLVCYPIVDIAARGNDVRAFVRSLEEIMIRTAADAGIEAVRNPRNPGVWVGDRKLGSIGVAIRRGISLHGFALNVDLDLTPFKWIHPCGLKGIRMTSFAELAHHRFSRATVAASVEKHLKAVFQVGIETLPAAHLLNLLPSG